ncbi:hypothetical protein Phum_PHUM546800 [Pediculus humanus corporis]|uniref:Kindlin-2 N-terminal domain-containing protein n=1 Tax=Pediculus humanus subsp. corporis TaxID=121224 RepID=E0W083_PEDHC|nr:uncharacterized protein Phum_PHUM546800 [Pediculus humanus corporis]EEB19039.1 hypothetical protein Phum_PHUM546800 [Pediculus humanus corporis]
MISNGHLVDGSWNLRFYVTDLQVERTLRVKGDLHIGGVILNLVEDLETVNSMSFNPYQGQTQFLMYLTINAFVSLITKKKKICKC